MIWLETSEWIDLHNHENTVDSTKTKLLTELICRSKVVIAFQLGKEDTFRGKPTVKKEDDLPLNTLTICLFKATLIREKKKNIFTISNSYKRSRCPPTLERRHVNPTGSSACPYPSVVLTLEICAMTATESREMSRSPLLSTWTNHNYRKVVRQTGFCFLLTRTSLMYWCNFDVD